MGIVTVAGIGKAALEKPRQKAWEVELLLM